ncbi:MAG: sodium-translocating pyrophosphatase [Verrucomicrobiales bacterium]|nr:sodium-translocating pyrophosphatase [Verrucomicrobiales bacterium]
MLILANFLIEKGAVLSLALAGIGLIVAIILIRMVVSQSAGSDLMKKVAGAIQDGAKAYLRRQVVTISIISVGLAVVLFLVAQSGKVHAAMPVGFLIGAVCSLLAGYIGMRIAVMANVRTTQAASESEHKALNVAFNGGAVTGLLVVGLALLSVGIFWLVMAGNEENDSKAVVDSLIGLALGSSLISVFARLGGGIYTKAADVGADLVGKIEQGLDEDDPRNPATIADNVGDNVGDCAGMAADVFETYAVSLIGALLLGTLQAGADPAALIFPFLIGGIAIVGSVIGILWVNIRKGSASRLLMEGVFVASLLSAIAYWPVSSALFPEGLAIKDEVYSAVDLFGCAVVGIIMTFAVVLITNYYTATKYRPVQKIARASQTGHATNIIAGLGVGNMATGLPVALICVAIWTSYSLGDLYGVSIAVMAMLALAGIIVSLDAFGPITDNAGGIAVMGELPAVVRERTDALDAVGNTMKAVTKGYAIASAGVAALVLFGSYFLELEEALGHVVEFSLKEPKVIIGMFIGGLLPFIFSALSMDAVGRAAGAVVTEVRRQISERPGIMEGKDEPEYARCVDIVTRSALREMVIPALLPVVTVIVVASIPALGYQALGGVLVGTIVTGLFVGLSMTAAGGAWDNAKKMIEDGAFGGKGSEAHAASITGDTVGDPYKDTSGPAINPMIKVTNIVAILAIPIFFHAESKDGNEAAEEKVVQEKVVESGN